MRSATIVATAVALYLGAPSAAEACQPWSPAPLLESRSDGIPANGALVLRLDRGESPGDITLSLRDPQDNDVPGTVEAFESSAFVLLMVFKPNSPLTPNVSGYRLHVSGGFGGYDGDFTFAFDTLDAVGSDDDPLSRFEAEFATIDAPRGEYCCCAAYYTCTYGPTCLPESRVTLPGVAFSTSSDLADPGQWLFRVTPEDASRDTRPWRLGRPFPASFEAASDSYCVKLEARSLVSNESFTRDYCVQHEESADLFETELLADTALAACMTPPPPKLREQWCEQLVAICDSNPSSAYDIVACAQSLAWCQGAWRERPAPEVDYQDSLGSCDEFGLANSPGYSSAGGAAGAEGQAGTGNDTADAGSGGTTRTSAEPHRTSSGCGCHAAPRTLIPNWAPLLMAGATFLRRRRVAPRF